MPIGNIPSKDLGWSDQVMRLVCEEDTYLACGPCYSTTSRPGIDFEHDISLEKGYREMRLGGGMVVGGRQGTRASREGSAAHDSVDEIERSEVERARLSVIGSASSAIMQCFK